MRAARLWSSPNCDLTLTIAAGEVTLVGEYERTTGALSGLLSGQKTTRYRVQYNGKIRGRRVVGSLSKKAAGETATSTILGELGIGDETQFAMVIDADDQNISVAEQLSSTTPNFYQLHAKDASTDQLTAPAVIPRKN